MYRSTNVEVAQGNCLKIVDLGVGEAQPFSAQLARSVGAVWLAGGALVNRQSLQFAKNAGGRREDDLPDPVAAAGFQNLQRANDVGLGISDGVVNGRLLPTEAARR